MTYPKSSFFSFPLPKDATKRRHSGMRWFVLTGALSVVINTLMRVLSESFGYHPFQLVFFYSAMGAGLYLPAFLRSPHLLHTKRVKLYATRAVLEVSAFSLVFLSLTLLPFAMFTTLTFTTPIIASFAAVYLLGEHMTPRKWIGLLMGFSGIIIVANPSSESTTLAVLLPVAASVCFAGCGVSIRKLAHSEPPARIAFITLSMMAVVSFPLALPFWQSPSVAHIPYLLILASLVAAVQFCVGQALQRVELSVAQPLLFLNLIWSIILGYLLFGEQVQLTTMLGACCIVAGVIYSVRQKHL